MYIAIYVAVILLVGAGMVASFVLYQKKQKQRADCLKKQRSQNTQKVVLRI
jgi:flagellar basal body-associated protein FliL